ncbi:MAG: TIGR03118 family protein [Gemmatimonadota bacterium]|nr:TIGR03118 family protein [Gemmatimonadota bacterium]
MHAASVLGNLRLPLVMRGLILVTIAACADNTVTNPVLATGYIQAKLVGDNAAQGATIVDASLVNPWGLAFSPGGTLWTSNNATGTSTLYNGAGVKQALVVAIPSATSATGGGAPTGVIFNSTADFVIPGGTKASFIFASEDGTISGWNGGTVAKIVADKSATGAVYKGLAFGTNAAANFLYATNFAKNKVDVFNATYQLVSSFTDPGVPAGYAPFGIQNIGGQLYVTFAKQKAPANKDDEPGVGNGYVDIFNTDGTLSKRLISNGRLNSPWGLALAPSTFGSAAGAILVGNFGDGLIGAYDAATGTFLGFLHDAANAPITIGGLWGLMFSPVAGSTSLYFSAGPSGETHGLIGTIAPQ